MNQDVKIVVETCAQQSHDGEIHFGQVVAMLAAAGIESYFADYRGENTTYYTQACEAHSVPLATPKINIATEFDIAGVQAAIHGAQSGKVMYPEFLQLTMQAGCVGYMTCITGKQVQYFGRSGEIHIERFPDN